METTATRIDQPTRRSRTGHSDARRSIASNARYEVALASSDSEIEDAQRLRYQVFFEEMGAQASLATQRLERDIDGFDADCEHLLVREARSGQLVGCYRIMQPHVAQRRGSFYSDQEFDLTRLHHIRSRTAELGRACIHPEFRNGSVIMLLWSALARYMHERGYEYAIGCASVPLSDGHANASAVYRELAQKCLAPAEYRVFPRHAYALEKSEAPAVPVTVKVPPLLKGYARLGAWIGGEPAWDADFNTADIFVLLPMARISDSYAKHFWGEPGKS